MRQAGAVMVRGKQAKKQIAAEPDRRVTDLEAVLLICVRDLGRSHGFVIGQRAEEVLGKRQGIGTMYKILHRLERLGFLSAEWETEEDEDHAGPKRRYYTITAIGERAIVDRAAEAQRMALIFARGTP